jgi:acetyl-CoA acetyltransferase
MQRVPLTMDAYLESRWIVEPFRLYDICLETDGACAVVVASDDVARSCRTTPVSVLSWGLFGGAGPGLDLGDLLEWDDLTHNYGRGLADGLFGRAGISMSDVDVAEIYDCFTFTILLTLESLGLFAPGEAGAYFESGGGRLGSELPVNTHGGLLSEAYIHGMNTVYEAVEQLRGDAGERQVEDAEVALVTSGAMTIGSGMILGRAR